MTIYLNYYKATPVNRKKLLETYDKGRSYNVLAGMPLIISVEGTYVYVNDLPKLVVNKHQGFIVNQWVAELKHSRGTSGLNLEFKWKAKR